MQHRTRFRPETEGTLAEAAPAGARATAALPAHAPAELAVTVPSLNERDNVEPLLSKLALALDGLEWEAVFVDDDSQGGTWALLQDLQRRLPHVRALRRIGRRGLASACIEGMLATSVPYLAVIDADLQHDEAILPDMLAMLKAERLDVVGRHPCCAARQRRRTRSRPSADQPAGPGAQPRRVARRPERPDERVLRRAPRFPGRDDAPTVRSRLQAPALSVRLVAAPGALRRGALPIPAAAARAEQAACAAPARVRQPDRRQATGQVCSRPLRHVTFALVGPLGVVVHLLFLAVGYRLLDIAYYYSQVIATIGAMTVNFNLNNLFTYRDRRLHGMDLLYGQSSFYLICSIGAIANFQIAQLLFELQVHWALAGALGAAVCAVWNFAVSSTLTWRKRDQTDASRSCDANPGHRALKFDGPWAKRRDARAKAV